MPSIFTRILRGEIPCEKVLEDAAHLAFMEIRPLAPGHVLVIPKKETDYFFDIPEGESAALMAFCKKVARAMKKAVPCEKIAVVVYGLEVRHAHVHLVPVNGTPGELDFAKPRSSTPDVLAATAAKIRAAL